MKFENITLVRKSLGKKAIAFALAGMFVASPTSAFALSNQNAEVAPTVVMYGNYDDALEVPTSSITGENSDRPKLEVSTKLEYFSRSEKAQYDEILDPMKTEYDGIYNEITGGVYHPTSSSTANKNLSMTRFLAVINDFENRWLEEINDQDRDMRDTLKKFMTYFVNQLKMGYFDNTDIRLSTLNSFNNKNACVLMKIDNKYYTVVYPKSGSTIDYSKGSEPVEFSRTYNNGTITPENPNYPNYPVNPSVPNTNVTFDNYGNAYIMIGNQSYQLNAGQYQVYSGYVGQINSYYSTINSNITAGKYTVQMDPQYTNVPMEGSNDAINRFLGDLNRVNRTAWNVFGSAIDANVKTVAAAYLTYCKSQAISSMAGKAGIPVGNVTSVDSTYYYLRTGVQYDNNHYELVQYGKNMQGQFDLNHPIAYYSVQNFTNDPVPTYTNTATPNTYTPSITQPTTPSGTTTPTDGGYYTEDGTPVDPSEIIPIGTTASSIQGPMLVKKIS